MENRRFWETENLSELTHDEWESLCSGCARCCAQRTKTGTVASPEKITSLCYLLDVEACRCSSYVIRQELVPSCIILSPDRTELFEQMPETCSYRLLHEGQPLPDWHPLITGDPSSNLPHKVVVGGKLNVKNPEPTIQPIDESAQQKEEKTNQMAEDAKELLYSTLNTIETTSLTGKFLTTASHEIRTSLNGIVGMAQLISDTQLTHEQRNCIDTILQSTTGLLKTISYVLDISKIESGQMNLCETVLDLRSMCNRLYSTFRPLAEQKGLDFKCECQRNVPLSVLCDEGLMERMLGNLVENALKYTLQGSVILNIECSGKSPKGANISFQIIDTGTGLDEGQQAAIKENPTTINAESFQQLHRKTGMGLAVSRQLIELMGGSLDLVSTKKGTAFCVNLTLRQANSPASFNPAEADRIKTIKPNTRVLLAEDNKVNQKVVTSILRKAGCEVDAVDNGKDAILKIRKNHYDMVLMDCGMPVMDGFEATTHIRAMGDPTCRMPIVALTAHAMKDDKQKCLDSGMDDYLPKPVGRQELIDAINKHVTLK